MVNKIKAAIYTFAIATILLVVFLCLTLLPAVAMVVLSCILGTLMLAIIYSAILFKLGYK